MGKGDIPLLNPGHLTYLFFSLLLFRMWRGAVGIFDLRLVRHFV